MEPATLTALYAEFKALGGLTAFTVLVCYVHAFVIVRPVIVRALGILEAVRTKLGISADELAAGTAQANGEVPTPTNGAVAAGVQAFKLIEGGSDKSA